MALQDQRKTRPSERNQHNVASSISCAPATDDGQSSPGSLSTERSLANLEEDCLAYQIGLLRELPVLVATGSCGPPQQLPGPGGGSEHSRLQTATKAEQFARLLAEARTEAQEANIDRELDGHPPSSPEDDPEIISERHRARSLAREEHLEAEIDRALYLQERSMRAEAAEISGEHLPQRVLSPMLYVGNKVRPEHSPSYTDEALDWVD